MEQSLIPDYKYLDKLNEQQRIAVEYIDGPSLVIAGAGSGKTRVLTYKIVHLLNLGYEPSRILALTFTNKAAREMKERVAKLVGARIAARIPMGTFHSQFLRILRHHAERIGFKSTFSIYDTSDSRNLIKMIIKELGLSDKDYKPNTIAATISNAKNAMMSPAEYDREYHIQDIRAKRPMTTRIYELYVERCRMANAMDFDDIIFFMNILLSEHEDVRDQYSEYFRYILVDEYQDTNFAQHTVISQLAKPYNRICVVGDDAQSIYSFRGANIDNIIRLERFYPGLKTFKLERNYRSTQNIVNAAGSLIDKNTKQLRKKVFSENDLGSPVEIIQTYSDLEEAALIALRISQSIMTEHDSYEDYAVLYRTNAQSRVLEEALRKRAIGYRIYGGTAFYQRKEVKDIISYFRVIVNPDDDEALRRIVNYPARGIGETTMKKIQAAASEAKVSLWQVMDDPDKYSLSINSGTAKKLQTFVDLINTFIKDNEQSNAFELGQLVFNRTGILTMLSSENTPESISRKENLMELLNGIKEFVDSRIESGEGEATLTAFLSEVMLATDQDQKDEQTGPKVTLMTAHAAKGLEFKHVYIVGVEEELFPSAMSMDSLAQVEEERRLLYVAITRAEKSCMLTYAKSRFRNGQTAMASPSRFLSEIDPAYVKMDTTSDLTSAGYGSFVNPTRRYHDYINNNTYRPLHESSFGGHISINEINRMKRPNAAKPTCPADENVDMTLHSVNDVRTGMKIEHKQFGIGIIEALGNVSGMPSIVVEFKKMGKKNLLLQYAKFKIID